MAEQSAQIQVRTLRLPKRGHSEAEYEDAYAGDAERGRFALADGASESCFAGLWARLLVDGFVQAPGRQPGTWASWLPPLQERWLAAVSGQPLPWYTETKVQQGAFATFLGLAVETTGLLRRRRWRAIAVGDGCLFQVRGGQLRRAFPMTRSEDFGSTPWLVGSRNAVGANMRQKEVHGKGDWRTEDQFWLMTDALAQWFLQQVEGGRQPWHLLETVLSASVPEEVFAGWIDELRNKEELRNDDVTVALLRWSA